MRRVCQGKHFFKLYGEKTRFGEGNKKSHIKGEIYFLSIIYSNIRWAMGGKHFSYRQRGREGGGTKIMSQK